MNLFKKIAFISLFLLSSSNVSLNFAVTPDDLEVIYNECFKELSLEEQKEIKKINLEFSQSYRKLSELFDDQSAMGRKKLLQEFKNRFENFLEVISDSDEECSDSSVMSDLNYIRDVSAARHLYKFITKWEKQV